jgi:hypothetical protein
MFWRGILDGENMNFMKEEEDRAFWLIIKTSIYLCFIFTKAKIRRFFRKDN